MLTLILLRHAKSSWDIPGQDDFKRALAPRGRMAAPAMGAEIKRLGHSPDYVLCSPAVRTRDTLALVLPYLDPPPREVYFEDELYLAPAGRLLERLRRLPGDCRSALLVGHNPSLQNLAVALAGSGPADKLQSLRAKFPTAALAILTFEAGDWRELEPRSGTLVHFATPRALSRD